MGQLMGSTGNWRDQLKINQRRTKIVIALFIFIYLAVGFLIDVVLTSALHNVPAATAFSALIQGHVFPRATFIMGGVAAVALFITYSLHDKIMLLGTEYQEITAENREPELVQLYHVVEELTIAAGLRYIPKIYLINADYMNAFASGYSEKSAMVAITRGLMEKLDRNELQAVMAHELSHIRHQDIKLTLTASILSNITLIAIDLLFRGVLFSGLSGRGDKERGNNKLLIIILILRFVLPIITVLLLFYLSRTREYMADAGSVELLRDNQPLARALIKISQDYQTHQDSYSQQYSNAHEDVRRAAYLIDPSLFGLSGMQSVASFFSTHPGLEDRLKAIGFQWKDDK